MVPLTALWLPILLSAVAVFLVSSLIHMVLTYHKSDFKAVPSEEAIMASMRPYNIPPGDYFMPYCRDMKEMSSPEYIEKLNKGPNVIMTVRPNGPGSMGKSLTQWFLYSIVVGIFVAWIAGRALGAGAEYLDVFCFAVVTAFAGYGLAVLQQSIWWGKSWMTTTKTVFDALLYSLVTAGIFGWLWP
jgi:hypothetical protein